MFAAILLRFLDPSMLPLFAAQLDMFPALVCERL
jgi:hypothetical protein